MSDLTSTFAALALATLAGCVMAPAKAPAPPLAGDSGLVVIEITVKGME